MNIVVGATGLLGSTLLRSLGENACIAIPRQNTVKWLNFSVNEIRQDLLKLTNTDSTAYIDLFYALGNTNPKTDPRTLSELNFLLPEKILNASVGLPIRVITFGSIHELSSISNPYMESKRKLANLLTATSHGYNHIHFLLHTLYSGTKPHSHMLLGQMLHSIQFRRELKMSSGLQLRQYHHVEDVVKIMLARLSTDMHSRNYQVNGPETIRIRDLAIRIYNEFNELPLLKLNSLPTDEQDVFDASYKISEVDDEPCFRPSIDGVLSEFKNLLK